MKAWCSVVLWVAAALLVAACTKKDAAPEKPLSRDARDERVIRGEYLTAAGDCYACHTVRGGEPYAGGLEMPTPFGKLHVPNITPHKEHGIGTWSADDFWRAMHEGKSKDGSFLYPAFPYNNYTKVTREDSDAIYAYLMTVQPSAQKRLAHEMKFPFNQRELLAGWRALYFKAEVFKEDPKQSKEWNRGAYLVEGLGHCNACHATRNLLGAVAREDDYSGGLIPMQNWYAPSLTSSRESGLGDWDTKEIVELLRTGVSERGSATGPMAEVVQHSLQNLTMTDLSAMALYLKSQAEKAPPAAPLMHKEPSEALVETMMRSGAKIYKDLCASCHQEDGRGVPRIYPPLAGNKSITIRNPVNAIRIVLNGGFPPSTEGNPRPYGMPPFYQDLSDEQVAAVVTYIRRSWGNSAPATWPPEVNQSRGLALD